MVTFQYFFSEDYSDHSAVTFGYPPSTGAETEVAITSSYSDFAGVVGPNEWALQVDGVQWGFYPVESAITYSNDVAIIASAYDFIALPSSLYSQIEEQLIRFGFTCVVNIDDGDVDCAIAGSCDYYAGFLPALDLKFMDNTYHSFSISIDPTFYLLTLGSQEQECLVLLTQTKEEASFVLGGPFFRAYTIALNFNETNIYIYKNETAVSPIVPANPDVDDGQYYD